MKKSNSRANFKKKILKVFPHCFYCLRKISLTTSNFDHVKPRCADGKNNKSNMVLSCLNCNNLKGCMPVKKWFFILRQIKKDHGGMDQFLTLGKGLRRKHWKKYLSQACAL